MITATIAIPDLQRLLASLKELGGDEVANEIAKAVATEGTLSRVRNYPAPTRKSQAFKSPQQRRFFFAALRSGQISVPYQRTSTLLNNWQVQAFSRGATVANRTPYATLVVGLPGEQAAYHAGNWRRVDEVAAESEAQDGERLGVAAVMDWIRRKGLA